MKNQINVLSYDLGSNLGWSRNVCILRPTLQINVVEHGTVYLDHLATEYMQKNYNPIFTRSRVRMIIFEEIIRKQVDMMKFDCFTTEDVFCNPHRVNSFRALCLYMETLERIVNVEKQKRLYQTAPTSIKKYISGYGQADKSQVQEAIIKIPCISMKNMDTATEHAFDSVAGCYAFVQECLLNVV